MTAKDYARISAPFRGKTARRALIYTNRLLTAVGYAVYPLLLGWLAWQRDGRLVRAVLVPAVTFCLLSAVRARINRPRPYEALDMDPIIHKNTHGKSMPSRHVFSMVIIAMTVLWVAPVFGVILLILGAVMGALRVIGGVHYPEDVAVGALVGVVSGVVGYWVI